VKNELTLNYFEISPEKNGLGNPWWLKDLTQVRRDKRLEIRERIIYFSKGYGFFQNHFINGKS